jgi:nucleoid-associated protein YgaU
VDRLLFYKTDIVDGVSEVDYLTSALSNFIPKYELTTYRVSEEDILRPDLISRKVYNTEEYWWFILFYNSVVDPFTELEVGDLLFIPNLLDIYDLYKGYRQR